MDRSIGYLVDLWMSFPPVVLSLVLMVSLGVGIENVILSIVLVDWMRFCRVVRSEVMVVRQRDYVLAAQLLNFTHLRIMLREILPAALPLMITLFSLEMGVAITVEALRNLTLSIGRGRVLGVVGESGAGKSMLARLISGLLPSGFAVTSGSMHFAGQDMLAMPQAKRRALLGRKIAFIPQEPLTALNPLWTIADTFNEHLSRVGVPSNERWDTVRKALESVQLPVPVDMLKCYPHQLSGRQCQRVLIAMAFASNPALLIAGEPTTALDVVTQTRVMRMLAEQ